MMPITPVVKQLLIINIIFFAGAYFVPQANEYLSLHYFQSPGFGIWQLITHMFMHGNVWHIAFNMLALYSFGSNLEHYWGAKKFLFFYISCGLGAALLDQAVHFYEVSKYVGILEQNGFNKTDVMELLSRMRVDTAWEKVLTTTQYIDLQQNYAGVTLGASGAVYGLLIAFAFMFPNAGIYLFLIPIPIKAKYLIPLLLVYDLTSGLYGNSLFGGSDGIAHFAHLGGALVGLVMMLTWRKNKFTHNRWN